MSHAKTNPKADGTLSDNLEVEVKFLAPDLATLRRRLLELGAAPTHPRIFERNERFETADAALLRRGELLRLRQDSGVRLTFKGPAAADATSEVKVREEIEVGVADFDAMSTILRRLGFEPVQTYEKYRETFEWGDLEVVLDEMPYGDFIELEGPESSIREAADRLGLDWSERITTNYLSLMAHLKAAFGLMFDDLTFSNFDGVEASIAALAERHPEAMRE